MKDYKLTLEYYTPDETFKTYSELVNSHKDAILAIDSWLYKNSINNDYRLVSVKIKEF